MKGAALALCLLCLGLQAQDLSKLPEWAQEPAGQALREAAPPAADAWVLLQRQVYTYEGQGEYRLETFRLVKILGQRGLEKGSFAIESLGGKAHAVKTLKGWNLRPDGEVVKLSRQDVKVEDPDDYGEMTTTTVTGATLTRLAVGSLVAYQCEEIDRAPMGPVDDCYVLEHSPVRRWECRTDVRKPLFGQPLPVDLRLEPRHLKAWGLTPETLPGGGVAFANLPALPRNEALHPPLARILPLVEVRFLDADLKEAPSCASWDALARWEAERWRPAMQPSGKLATQGLAPRQALQTILAWMNRELIYRKVYLSPARGWIPLACSEVVRRRDGDCKDHAACFLGEAAGAGLRGWPALCAIGPGTVEPDQPPYPVFNHVIAALRLEESLGLPAEVQTAQGRFLLVDTTDRFCPFGRLPDDHRGRRVMICTDQGALWADVPAQATLPPALGIELQGDLAAGGTAQARIRLRETANACSLRAIALYLGAAGLKEGPLRALFDLPPTGTVSDLKIGDPLDLEHPFEVSFTLTRTGGMAVIRGRAHLDPWGLPETPGAIQKPGVPRVYPVEYRQSDTLDYHATWTFPEPVTPRLPALEAETPFRSLRWKASAEGRTVTLDFHLGHKDALFEGDQREAGVAAWKKDRNLLDRLNDEGRSFGLSAAP